jgi:hypothetical protein
MILDVSDIVRCNNNGRAAVVVVGKCSNNLSSSVLEPIEDKREVSSSKWIDRIVVIVIPDS